MKQQVKIDLTQAKQTTTKKTLKCKETDWSGIFYTNLGTRNAYKRI